MLSLWPAREVCEGKQLLAGSPDIPVLSQRPGDHEGAGAPGQSLRYHCPVSRVSRGPLTEAQLNFLAKLHSAKGTAVSSPPSEGDAGELLVRTQFSMLLSN